MECFYMQTVILVIGRFQIQCFFFFKKRYYHFLIPSSLIWIFADSSIFNMNIFWFLCYSVTVKLNIFGLWTNSRQLRASRWALGNIDIFHYCLSLSRPNNSLIDWLTMSYGPNQDMDAQTCSETWTRWSFWSSKRGYEIQHIPNVIKTGMLVFMSVERHDAFSSVTLPVRLTCSCV